MSLKRIAINASVVLGTLALAFLLYEFREALILFIFSLAVAAAARPYVESLSNRGVPSSLAIVLVYFGFILLLGVIFWAVGNSLANELQRLTNSLAIAYEQAWKTWPHGTQVQQLIIHDLPAPEDLYKSLSPSQLNSTMNGLLGFTLSSANSLGVFFTIVVLSIYWSIDRVHFERLWLSLLPVESRARARDIWRAIERDFGAYVRSEVLQSILAGALLGLGLWAMGIHYPTLLGLFAALAWLIPWLGGVLVVLPVAFVGFSQSLVLGVSASVYTIVVLFLLEFLIQPRFIRRRQFSSILSILLIIALIQPFGLMGFIVAPPLAAAIELIVRYNLRNRPVPESVQSAEQITLLRERINHIHEAIARSPEPPEPQTESILARLESLLERTNEVVEQNKQRDMRNRARV